MELEPRQSRRARHARSSTRLRITHREQSGTRANGEAGAWSHRGTLSERTHASEGMPLGVDGCGCMRCMCAHARTQARTHITHPSTLLSSASMRDLRERRAPLHRASSRLPRRVSAITNRSRVHAAATYNAQRATYVKTRNTISSPSIPQSTPRRRQRASDRRRGRRADGWPLDRSAPSAECRCCGGCGESAWAGGQYHADAAR